MRIFCVQPEVLHTITLINSTKKAETLLIDLEFKKQNQIYTLVTAFVFICLEV